MRPLACPRMCWWWWLFLMPGWPTRQPRWLGCSVDLKALLRCAGGPAPELCSPVCASDPSIMLHHLQLHWPPYIRPPTSLPCRGDVGTGEGVGLCAGLFRPLLALEGTLLLCSLILHSSCILTVPNKNRISLWNSPLGESWRGNLHYLNTESWNYFIYSGKAKHCLFHEIERII